MKRYIACFSLALLCSILATACSSEGDDYNEDWGGDYEQATQFNVNLQDALALVTQTEDASSSEDTSDASRLRAQSINPFEGNEFVSRMYSNMKKITEAGNVEEVLHIFLDGEDTETALDEGRIQPLPRISTIGISPAGDVYLHFERPFMYKEPEEGAADPWMSSSPYTCQVFKVTETLDEASESEIQGLDVSNVECIDETHEVDSWHTHGGLFQFDDDSNLYYTAHDPGSWKNVVYKYNPNTGEKDEVINANICFHDYLVTPEGGVFYTGTTSIGGDCSGSSFFRYITSSGTLTEITRDWWDYTWAPSANRESEKVIFYGPDTVTSGTPGWDSSCLYEFNPLIDDDPNTLDVDERATRLVDCRSDMWSYVYDWEISAEEQQTRCTEVKSFLGGNQVDDIIVDQGNEDIFYVVGAIRQKKAGQWQCHICVNENHCSDLSDPDDNQTLCETKSETWITEGRCYNDQVGDACNVDDPMWDKHWEGCQEPSGIGDRWSSEYTALAKVDRNTNEIEMISATTESVLSAKIIGSELYYTSYSTGTHALKKVGAESNQTLLSNIEIYKLEESPNSDGLLFNGLNFEDNQYMFGTFDPSADTPETTIESMNGLTGEVDTVVILQ